MRHEIGKNGACVAFGRFDGVHIGHRVVVDEVVRQSALHDLTPVVVCLPPGEGRVLTTREEQDHLFSTLWANLEVVHLDRFSPESFVEKVLVDRLHVQSVVMGSGDEDRLGIREQGIALVRLEDVLYDGRVVSSSRIEDELVSGSLQAANAMLGTPYFLMGTVVHGKQLGRTVGMPTANLGVPFQKRLPQEGVFATASTIDGHRYAGATHIGRRPAVDTFQYPTIETSLLDFSRDIYDRPMILEVLQLIRPVEKFENLEAVGRQVVKDLQFVREHVKI